MSWYDDGKDFDEYDPPYCEHCSGGTSYEGCKACAEEHEREKNRGCMEQEDWSNDRKIDGKWSNNPKRY